MAEVQAKRFDGERNHYDAPCCDVPIAVLEDAPGCKCPVCGSWLEQNGIGLSLVARVVQPPH